MTDPNETAGKLVAEALMKDPEVRRVFKQQLFAALAREAKDFAREEIQNYYAEIRAELDAHKKKFAAEAVAGLDSWWKKFNAGEMLAIQNSIKHDLQKLGKERLVEIVEEMIRPSVRAMLRKASITLKLGEFDDGF